MKKSAGLFFAGLCLVCGLIYFLTRPAQDSQPTFKEKKISEVSNDSADSDASAPRKWNRAKEGDASLGTDSANEIITQQSEDFTRGDQNNVVITGEGMKMGNNRAFICRMRPNYQFFGVFVSQEEFVSQPFDTVIPSMTLLPGKESEVSLEFRTRPIDQDWTVWEEVTPEKLNQPFHLPSPGAVWQYRLTFFANDPASSATVKNVTLATRASEGALASSPGEPSVDNAQ